MNIKQLREVAQAATPGPWRKESDGWAELRNVKHMVQAKDRLIAYGQMTSRDCAHIATFNPALIAKLLDVVEAAQVLIEHLDYRMTVSTVIDPKQYNIRGDDMRIIDGKIETARAALKALEG